MSDESEAGPAARGDTAALNAEWNRLRKAATVVALMTAPAFFLILWKNNGWSVLWALIGTLLSVAAFRGIVDLVVHKILPKPSLYGADREQLKRDQVARRQLWFWRRWVRLFFWLAGIFIVVTTLFDMGGFGKIVKALAPQLLVLALQLPL